MTAGDTFPHTVLSFSVHMNLCGTDQNTFSVIHNHVPYFSLNRDITRRIYMLNTVRTHSAKTVHAMWLKGFNNKFQRKLFTPVRIKKRPDDFRLKWLCFSQSISAFPKAQPRAQPNFTQSQNWSTGYEWILLWKVWTQESFQK